MKDPRVNGVRATRPKCVVVPRGDDVCHTRELALRQPGLGRLAGIAAFEDLNRRPPPFSIPQDTKLANGTWREIQLAKELGDVRNAYAPSGIS
jgi:hypothetical protein